MKITIYSTQDSGDLLAFAARRILNIEVLRDERRVLKLFMGYANKAKTWEIINAKDFVTSIIRRKKRISDKLLKIRLSRYLKYTLLTFIASLKLTKS